MRRSTSPERYFDYEVKKVESNDDELEEVTREIFSKTVKTMGHAKPKLNLESETGSYPEERMNLFQKMQSLHSNLRKVVK